MPMPWGFRHAEKQFDAFIADARERMRLESDNSTYTAVDGVLQTFRRRLTPRQAMRFADVLPELLRALFVYRWDPEAPPLPFAPRPDLVHEAQHVRPHHNLTPATCIEDVAWALRRSLRQRDLDRVLAEIGPEAEAFWHVEVNDPRELEQRII